MSEAVYDLTTFVDRVKAAHPTVNGSVSSRFLEAVFWSRASGEYVGSFSFDCPITADVIEQAIFHIGALLKQEMRNDPN